MKRKLLVELDIDDELLKYYTNNDIEQCLINDNGLLLVHSNKLGVHFAKMNIISKDVETEYNKMFFITVEYKQSSLNGFCTESYPVQFKSIDSLDDYDKFVDLSYKILLNKYNSNIHLMYDFDILNVVKLN